MITTEQVFQKARKFKEKQNRNHIPVTYHDYEYFKRMLHDNGLYGHESKLARILNI